MLDTVAPVAARHSPAWFRYLGDTVRPATRVEDLSHACDRWPLCSVNASPEARRYYDELRKRNKTHLHALRLCRKVRDR